jgi:hypothetical protein
MDCIIVVSHQLSGSCVIHCEAANIHNLWCDCISGCQRSYIKKNIHLLRLPNHLASSIADD